MGYIFQREWLEVARRAGGPLGLVTVGVACAGMALGVLRLRYSLLDPIILLALTSIGVVFAANFAAGAFASEREAARLINGEGGVSDREMVMGKTLAAATFGLTCWGAAMATGIAMLRNLYPSLQTPWERLGLLALFTLAAAWANACFAASLSLRLANETAARRLVRAPGLVMVLALVLAPRALPASIGEPLLALLRGGRLPFTLLVLTVLLLPAGFWLFRRALAALEERRNPISIVPQD